MEDLSINQKNINKIINDHLIPLYSYGVGTFDFDLKKVEPMAKLSQDKAEEHLKSYFETKNK